MSKFKTVPSKSFKAPLARLPPITCEPKFIKPEISKLELVWLLKKLLADLILAGLKTGEPTAPRTSLPVPVIKMLFINWSTYLESISRNLTLTLNLVASFTLIKEITFSDLEARTKSR